MDAKFGEFDGFSVHFPKILRYRKIEQSQRSELMKIKFALWQTITQKRKVNYENTRFALSFLQIVLNTL